MSCANWAEQLQHASFKGVPFQVDSADTTAGWDTVVREYPFQDLPSIQPMGESTNEFKLSAYVIGDDYMAKRDALARALRGEGLLSHPTFGYMMVWVQGTFTIREQLISDGGVARFDITFIKAESRRYPFAGINLRLQILDDILAVIEMATNVVASILSLTGLAFLRNTAIGQIADIIAAGENFINLIHSGKDSLQAARRQLFSINNKLPALADSDINNTVKGLAEIFKLPRGSIEPATARLVFDELQITIKEAAEPVEAAPYLTVSRKQQVANTAALNMLRDVLLLGTSTALLTEIEFENYADALSIRQKLNRQFKKLLNTSSLIERSNEWDQGGAHKLPTTPIEYGRNEHGESANIHDLHSALLKAHANMLEFVTEQSQSLGRISTYTPGTTEPVIFISYKLYGTAEYAPELYANNPHIKHPLIASPGRVIKIIEHAEVSNAA